MTSVQAATLGHGLENGSHVEQRYSIHPDDPLSARHEARWRS